MTTVSHQESNAQFLTFFHKQFHAQIYVKNFNNLK